MSPSVCNHVYMVIETFLNIGLENNFDAVDLFGWGDKVIALEWSRNFAWVDLFKHLSKHVSNNYFSIYLFSIINTKTLIKI